MIEIRTYISIGLCSCPVCFCRVGLICWGLARHCRQRLLFFFQQRCFILANKQNLHNVVNLSKIKCYHDTTRSWSRPTLRPREEWKCHCQVSCQKFVWRLAANPHLSLLQVKKSYRYFDLYDPHTNTSEIDMIYTCIQLHCFER
jgi:hypothetical protein